MTEFVPLHDEEDDALKAGIRFCQIAPDKPLRMTLYELDGYTEYIPQEQEHRGAETQAHVQARRERQTLLMGAQYYDDEYILRKLLTLNGDADMFDEIMARRENAEVDRFTAPEIDEESDVMDDEK